MCPYRPWIAIDPGDARRMGSTNQLPGDLGIAVDLRLNTHLSGRAIGPQDRVGGKQSDQSVQISTLRGVKKGVDHCTIRIFWSDAWQVGGSNLLTSSAGEFTGRFRGALENGRNFVEGESKQIVQDEGGRFEG